MARAVEISDFPVVTWAIRAGADVNSRAGRHKDPMLHTAAKNGHLDIVKCLVRNGCEVNARRRGFVTNGLTALHLAAQNGHLAVIKYLVDNGIQVHPRRRNVFTPLHYAVENGHLDVVKYFLECGSYTKKHTPLPVAQS